MAAAVAGALAVEGQGEEKGQQEEKSAEELMNEAGKAFGEIFAVQPPRDVFAGLWSGMRCVLSGVLLGLAGVVAQPIEGMRESGISGGVRGAVLGAFTGLLFSVTGLCAGMFQAVRGVLATPRALCMFSQGWRWDRGAGDWAEPAPYSLPAEAQQVLDAGGADEDEEEEVGVLGSPSRRRAVDSYYYDQLGVTPSASQRQIRQAYFSQSKRWHPDKTSEAKAKERFQAISEAYQVLSDPDRRRAYDTRGRQGAGEGFMDSRIFFSVLLGANALEPYVGRVRLAEMFRDSLFAPEAEDQEDAEEDLESRQRDSERSQRQQLRRQVRLAVSLAERLDARAATSSDAEFRESAHQEATALLSKDSSVERFLLDIGWIYANRAESHLARLDSRFGAFGPYALCLRFQRQGRQALRGANTARLTLRSFLRLREIISEADELAEGLAKAGEEDEAELPSVITSALPTFMETFLSLTAHDIVGTLEKVVDRVLGDASVDAAARVRRAEGLRELGRAFVGAAQAAAASRAGSHATAGTGTAGTPKAGSGEAAKAAAAAGGAEESQRSRRRFEEAFLASMGSGGSGS